MEIDTGASLSLVSEVTYKKLWPGKRLLPTPVKLTTYSGEKLLCFAGWLSECTASHTAQNNTLWSNVEYFHHKVCIFLLCGVQFIHFAACSLTTNLQSTIPVVGQMQAQVHHDNQSAQLSLVVVKGDGPSLLGRDWLSSLNLNWHQVYYHSTLQEVLDQNSEVHVLVH